MPSALVTGASRGIGAAIARRLAADGFDIAVHFHEDKAGAEATLRAVEAQGRTATLLQGDLRDAAIAWQVAERAIGDLDGLDAFVNNAGIYDRRATSDMTGDAWRATMSINLDGPAAICQAIAPTLMARSGSIVHVSSIAAMRGSSHGSHYAASKAALLGLTRAQALEFAPARVNAVCPGYIDTDMIGDDSPEKRAQRAHEVPLGRVGTPDDVAATVAFLCGRDAAYMTGQTLHVNGGLWMG